LLIGGAMAYTFFKTLGYPVGRSLVEEDKTDAARDILSRARERKVTLLLPTDQVVAEKLEAGVPTETLGAQDARIGDRMGLDIGPQTIEAYSRALADAKTVVWNGPMGVFEIEAFARGTMAVAQAVASVRGTTHRRRRLDRGGEEGRRCRSRHAHLHRRRRVARIPRRTDSARRSGPA
jgi:phosphoglycerate kinase